jgi:hypothetical protein
LNDSSRSLHVGKIPQFDGVGYSKWKNSMEEHLMVVNPALWTIVNRGVTFPSGDDTMMQTQANDIQCNYQALCIIKSSLSPEEYDKVDGLKSTKEVWEKLFINHEGSKQVRYERIRALKGELNHFIIKEDEAPQDIYNRLNKIVNKIKSLGAQDGEEVKWWIKSYPHTWIRARLKEHPRDLDLGVVRKAFHCGLSEQKT